MRRRRVSRILVALVCAACSATGVAGAPGGDLSGLAALSLELQPAPEAAMPAARVSSGPVPVLVRLAGEPAWTAYQAAGGRAAPALSRQRADARRAAVLAEQDAFLAGAARLGAMAGRRSQFLDNVVALDIDARHLDALRALPGVVAVGLNRRYERSHTTSMPLLRVTDAWSGTPSQAGAGAVIGIIDDGVDYTHRHFGGAGDYAANDRTVLGDVAWPPLALPSAPGDQLVIGGWDFVGDAYNVGLQPQPDPDPAGCPFSHGTHVAGSAAGHGVTAAGTTFVGDITQGNALFPSYPAASTGAFRVGPGAAPRAALVALRVFGCSGSTGTDILLQALDAAGSGSWLGQGVDVVNMSLGSAYGGSGPDDFLNGAQAALAELGIVVVASAGNSGDVQLVTGAPGTAASTVSVANVTDTSALVDGTFRYVDPADGVTTVQIAAVRGAMYPSDAPDPFTAGVALANPVLACTPLVPPAPGAWTGKWLLVDRGTCGFSIKVAAVKAAGAAGAIVVNNAAGPPAGMARTDGYDDLLPAIMVSQADGSTLKLRAATYAFGGTFDGTGGAVSYPETSLLANASTSRGGVIRGDDRILKPNLAAPGTTITSAGGGTNSAGYTISGTSMASPHIAGAAAILVAAHGRPADADGVALLKQRLMSSATRDIALGATNTPPLHSPQRVGSGMADVRAALDTPLVAFATDAPENGALSFGYPRPLAGSGPFSQARSITLRNLSGNAITVDASYLARSTWAGATVTIAPDTLTVPPNGTAQVQVTLAFDAEQPNLNLSGDPTFNAAGRTFLHEVSGLVAFAWDGGASSIRVPLYAAPHLTAATTAAAQLVPATPSGSTTLALGGTGFDLGPDANDHRSLASAYTLLATDGVESNLYWDANADGELSPDELLTDLAAADLHHVGATLVPAGPDSDVLVVGLSTHGEWTTPRDLFVEVYLDVDNDGTDDYVWYYGSAASDLFDLTFIALTGNGQPYNLGTRVNFAHGAALDSMLLRNNVMALPLVVRNPNLPSAVGGTNYAGGPIRITAVTYQRDTDFSLPIDVVESVWTPGLSFTGALGSNLSIAGSGQAFGVGYALDVDGPAPSILTLHHHNREPASRTQVTEVVLPSVELFSDGFED